MLKKIWAVQYFLFSLTLVMSLGFSSRGFASACYSLKQIVYVNENDNREAQLDLALIYDSEESNKSESSDEKNEPTPTSDFDFMDDLFVARIFNIWLLRGSYCRFLFHDDFQFHYLSPILDLNVPPPELLASYTNSI